MTLDSGVWLQGTKLYACHNHTTPHTWFQVRGALACPMYCAPEGLEELADVSGTAMPVGRNSTPAPKADSRDTLDRDLPGASPAQGGNSREKYADRRARSAGRLITIGTRTDSRLGKVTTWAIGWDRIQWILGPINHKSGRMREPKSYPGHRVTVERDVTRFGVELTDKGRMFIAGRPEDVRDWQPPVLRGVWVPGRAERAAA